MTNQKFNIERRELKIDTKAKVLFGKF